MIFYILILIIIAVIIINIKIVPQASAFIIERFGAYHATWSVGLHIKVPILEKVAKRVNLKEQVVDFDPQVSIF